MIREELGLFAQLLIGLLQFELLALQLLREGLGLLQQILSSGIGLDRIKDDADTFRQLIEERVVRGTKAIERRQLHHAFHLSFKDDRQNQNIDRARLPQAGTDRHVILWRIRDDNLFLFNCALANQPLAQFEGIVEVLPLAMRIARQQFQIRLVLVL